MTKKNIEKIIKEITKIYSDFLKLDKSRKLLHDAETKLIKKLILSIKKLPQESQPTKKELNNLRVAINKNLKSHITKINELF